MKQMIKDFLISTIFPTISIPMFMAMVIVVNWIYPQNPIHPLIVVTILVALVVWAIARWSLERKFSLIKEYKSLIISLKKHDKNEVIELIFSGWNPTSPPSHITARKFFDSKRIDIDRKSNELNTKLDKLIGNPYRLLYIDTTLIGKEFAELFIDIKTLYDNFVPMDSDSGFISDLKNARKRFTEIEKAVPDDLLPTPYIPWHP